MRILLLSNFYPPHTVHGLETACHAVADYLRTQGHTVTVFATQQGMISDHPMGFLNQPAQSQPLRVHAQALQPESASYPSPNFARYQPPQPRAALHGLQQVIEQTTPDLIIVWGAWRLAQRSADWAEQWLPGRVCYFFVAEWSMDLELHTQYWTAPAQRQLTEIMLKRPLPKSASPYLASAATSPQRRSAQTQWRDQAGPHILLQVGQLSDKAVVLLVGPEQAAAAPRAQPSAEPLKLVYVGRLMHDAGVHTALEALEQLKTEGLAERLHLTIVGSGHPAYTALLHHMVEEFGLGEQVAFIPQIPDKALASWLSHFDLCLSTSLWSAPLSRTVLEAMAAGLLVVGAQVERQAAFLTHDQNALTFPAGDAAALADRLRQVLQKPRHRVRLARAGQQTVLENFTLERLLPDLETYLVNVANNS